MILKIISKFIKCKKPNCLLITPPLLEPQTFYLAAPLLAGQLIHNGYSAKNLDLNIRFFRTVLSKNYIEKTRKLLDFKNIPYDNENVDVLLNNIETAINIYVKNKYDQEFEEAKKLLTSVLEFISFPYSSFNLNNFTGFEHCFNGFDYSYQNIKDMSFDKERNIFISFFEEIINEISEQNIDFVGITAPFPGTIVPAFTLARLLKEKTNIHVALGGGFLKPESVLNNPEILDIYCDSVLIGDGEESIVELVKSLENRQKKEKVPGLICKNKKNKVLFNPPIPIKTMNNIANISLEGLNLKEYTNQEPSIYIMISKGCYWGKCIFCSLGIKYGRYCIKSPDKVVAHIKELQEKYQVRGCFQFQDDAIPPAYLSRLADEIIKQELNIHYSIFGRLEEEFSRELLEKLYKSGLINVYWGLESGSQRVLDLMNKGIKLENVLRILKDSHEVGIHNMVGIIVNFPTETMDECNETLAFLKTIEKYVVISPGNFSLMENSIIEKNNEQFGVEIFSYNDFNYNNQWRDTNIDPVFRQKKWEKFCECVKNAQYKIDPNKVLEN